VYWQFVGSIKGMGKACLKFQTPVTGGNVSFYNQSSYEGPVFPTPTIGMLGIVDDKKHITSLSFKNEGDAIVMIGRSRNDINSSEYVYSYHGIKNTPAPDFDLDEEYNVQAAIREMIRAGAVHSAHDCADGGLFITLLESGMQHQLGFDITSAENVRKDAFLFGEAQSRVVVSISPTKKEAFEKFLNDNNFDFNNPADASITCSSLGLSGSHSSEFSVVSNNCSGQQMGDNSSCRISLKGVPQNKGTRDGSMALNCGQVTFLSDFVLTSLNNLPVTSPVNVTLLEDHTTLITLGPIADIDGDALTYTFVKDPSKGSIGNCRVQDNNFVTRLTFAPFVTVFNDVKAEALHHLRESKSFTGESTMAE
jgi:hypothetical protein